MPPVAGGPAAATPPPPAAYPPGAYPPPSYPPPGYPPPYPGAAPYYGPPPKQADFGNLFSGTFEVWGRDFVPLFVVYLVLSLITGSLTAVGAVLLLGVPYISTGLGGVTFTIPAGTNLALFAVWSFVSGIISWILTSVVLGGVTDFAVHRYRGENVRIMDSLSRGFKKVLSILGANLVFTLIIIGLIALPLLGLLAVAFVAGPAAGIALLCGLLIALPFLMALALYMAIALGLYAPAIMLEGSHALDSLARSWDLTKGHKWSIFAAGLVIGIIAIVIGAIGSVGTVFALNPIVQIVVSAILAGITGSWFTILASVAYELIRRTPPPYAYPPPYGPTPYPPGPAPPR